MINTEVNNKAIKDLEFMAKKLKKRISILEKMDLTSNSGLSEQISTLIDEYRRIKREIVDISNMTYGGGRIDG